MNHAIRDISILVIGLVSVGNVLAEETRADESVLTINRLFGTGEFDTRPIPMMRWSKQTAHYFTLEESQDGNGKSIFKVDPATGKKGVFVAATNLTPKGKRKPLKVEEFSLSRDESKLLIYTNSKRVWRRNTRGDYWVLNLASKKLSKLGGKAKPSTLMFAKFSPDGSRVGYVRENNVYVQDLNSLKVTAVTSDGSETVINGTGDWVNEEELGLRDCFRWSPDGGHILFWQFDTSGVMKFHMINNTVSKTPKIQTFAYPKVGEKNSATRLGIVSADGGDVQWVFLKGNPREHYLPHAEWSPDGESVLVQQFNRLQNQHKVFQVNPQTGDARHVMTETDNAWVDNVNPVRWLNNGESFLWLSERTGWRHAYVAHIDGSDSTQITRGDFDITDIAAIDEARGWLYYIASPGNATQRYLFRVHLDGSNNSRLSPGDQPGWHAYNVSPNANWAVHTYSNFTTPPVVELLKLADHSVVRTLEDNEKLREKLAKLNKPEVEFFKVAIEKGVALDGYRIGPVAKATSKKHPLLMHVYGEPAGQTAKDIWPGTRGLWHWMLAQQGFVIANVDNRGTKVPRGREWRKSIYRQVGIIAPKDQAKALKVLLKRWEFVDADRVGIWGWSGGGSMSLNAMFRYPDLYRTAVAIAPVPDQRLYDTIYQERYMGLPSDNQRGFRDGSPITHAQNLRGNLLLIHGTGDDNCHYQGTERLMNKLIATGKYFSILPYPNRTHSVKEEANTVPHFWASITRYLHENLLSPHAPKPQTAHEIRDLRGWKLHISRVLLATEPKLTARAIELLDKQLEEITRVVPESALGRLKKVPLYFMPEYPGVPPRAEYHSNAGWLRNNGRDPDMAKAVEFTNIRIFEAETNRMPNFALHELAHAFHDRELPRGFGNETVAAAYARAKETGKYDNVERHFGNGRPNTFEKAYAMTNPAEYFAETTEAFFSRNDFYPFTQEELKKHDPAMFQILKKLWK